MKRLRLVDYFVCILRYIYIYIRRTDTKQNNRKSTNKIKRKYRKEQRENRENNKRKGKREKKEITEIS